MDPGVVVDRILPAVLVEEPEEVVVTVVPLIYDIGNAMLCYFQNVVMLILGNRNSSSVQLTSKYR